MYDVIVEDVLEPSIGIDVPFDMGLSALGVPFLGSLSSGLFSLAAIVLSGATWMSDRKLEVEVKPPYQGSRSL